MKILNLMLVFSMPRTGHHAIIEWLTTMLDGAHFFDFDMTKVGADPAAIGAKVIESPNYKWPIWNMEAVDPAGAPRIHQTFTVLGETKDVLIIRSYENWLASFYKMQLRFASDACVNLSEDVQKYIQAYAREASRGWLAQVGHADKMFTIRYDHWLTDDAYRQERAESLGLSYEKPNLDTEFAVCDFPDKQHLSRADALKEDEFFQGLLDEDLVARSKEVFE